MNGRLPELKKESLAPNGKNQSEWAESPLNPLPVLEFALDCGFFIEKPILNSTEPEAKPHKVR